ncbi:sulfotransferase [Actinomadura fulvescens]|uniref:Sulfotransferase family protein n=1 Tax=Actinomadura fulvescens TaxID=46160 RepID=A0ABP6BZ51_9ACTN
MLDVIGAGFGRTGTLSLRAALERLGFGPCHHMMEVIDDLAQVPRWERAAEAEDADWEEVYEGYRSTVDWPGARFWRELAGRYPQARVILTVRDAERWYDSVRKSIYAFATAELPPEAERTIGRLRALVDDLIWEGTFDGRFEDRAYAISIFEAHNEAVRTTIDAGRLLVFEVAQGWEPLCGFLGVPVPDEPFPRLNDQASIHAMVRERGLGSDG